MSKAVVFFAQGTEECEALLVVDLLRRAKVEVVVASASGSLQVTGSHGITLTADALAEDVDYSGVDLVVLPGGIPGTPNLAANQTVCDTVKAFAAQGKKVAAICAAPSILADLGLLEGKKATAHAAFQDKLAGASPPAMAWAAPSPLDWSWCASWQAPMRPPASRRLSPTSTACCTLPTSESICSRGNPFLRAAARQKFRPPGIPLGTKLSAEPRTRPYGLAHSQR